MPVYMNYFNQGTITQMLLVFAVAFYLLECFMGYRFIKTFISITGFFTGFIIGFIAAFALYGKDAYIPTVAGILTGILLALVAYKLYIVGIFILCGSIAASAAGKLPFAGDGSQDILKMIICIGAFIVVGILAVKFAKLFIILVTSIGGAVNAVNLLKTPVAVLNENTLIRIAVIVILAAIGVIVQKLTTKKQI